MAEVWILCVDEPNHSVQRFTSRTEAIDAVGDDSIMRGGRPWWLWENDVDGGPGLLFLKGDGGGFD